MAIIRPEFWGYSSVGRVLAWHARGQRFDPAYLHQSLLLFLSPFVFISLSWATLLGSRFFDKGHNNATFTHYDSCG